MKIVVHAGLHKSGTTSIQGHWREAFGKPGPVWYPSRRRNGNLRAHHAYFWPLLDAFVGERPAYLEWAAAGGARTGLSLRVLIDEAVGRDVQVLLMSTEELEQLQAGDVPRFQRLFAKHEVTMALTVSRPLHRWCSGWQSLVKHGLAEYPRDAARHVQACVSLTPGRLEELVTLLPAHRRLVRVVRTSPPEDSLAEQLASTLGLSWPGSAGPLTLRNTSLGTDVEILRRMNRADLSLGTIAGNGRQILKRLKDSVHSYRERPELAEAYEPPEELWAAAEAEHEFLVERAGAAGVEVVDPHGQLADWMGSRPSDWYVEISRREAVIPELEAPMELTEQLWRVRQARYSLQAQLERADRKAAASPRERRVPDPGDRTEQHPEQDSNP
ncbi:MAG: hypothetical protein M3Q72_13040 [Actinomycetota bacterium]|nr:hypothetical protein [Actinomycetota bacterium]